MTEQEYDMIVNLRYKINDIKNIIDFMEGRILGYSDIDIQSPYSVTLNYKNGMRFDISGEYLKFDLPAIKFLKLELKALQLQYKNL